LPSVAPTQTTCPECVTQSENRVHIKWYENAEQQLYNLIKLILEAGAVTSSKKAGKVLPKQAANKHKRGGGRDGDREREREWASGEI